ncbi:DEXDc+HELICc'DEXDc+HELICc' [Cryptosporidium canis]|uniref:DEXDc+HELICc'DEXDc+HELICc n=1 Tax=Cryptosporidium canis TaxID=195482 RepID=A0A9D5DFN1_9CRYT|nr:DEXDc+HELICc'DEXDc+HELICc' [Cryptosporidium canis]
MAPESKDRWVLLGVMGSQCEESVIRSLGHSFWVSDLRCSTLESPERNLKLRLIQDLFPKEGIWPELIKICDGVRLDSFVESESDFSEEILNLFSEIKLKGDQRVKVYLWYNFKPSLLSNYNSCRGILTLSNSTVSYEVLSHLKSEFSVKIDEKGRQQLLSLFKTSILSGKLFPDLIIPFDGSQKKQKLTEPSYDLCFSSCKVLNCIEHLTFTSDFINSLSINAIMRYLNKELESSVSHLFHEENLSRYDTSYMNRKICHIPTEIWWIILDFLDEHSIHQIRHLSKSLRLVWLAYHRNNLLPHQRRSVTWLLERESHTREKDHWLLQSPIKYLTSSDDIFKYLSIWHFLTIKDLSKLVEPHLLDKIIWDSNQCHLMGINQHPKYLNFNISNLAFQRNSNIALYFNHTNKVIHLGFIPKSIIEFKNKYFGITRGGIFCDEPGLGKTLTILSLISKTYGQISNTHINRNISYFEYPDGVIQLLYQINQTNSFRLYLTNINNSTPPIGLINLLPIPTQTCSEASSDFSGSHKPFLLLPSGSTLIIVPNHLIQHWTEEIKKWYNVEVISSITTTHLRDVSKSQISNHEALIYLFDDPSKDHIPEPSILASSKIVILSYRMLTRQFQLCKVKQNYTRAYIDKNKKSNNSDEQAFFRPEMSSILQIKWLRLIMDEGHNIGNSEISSTLYQQFIFKIQSEFKWIMSGTPLPISIIKSIHTNIPNIFKFLKLAIICEKTRNYEQESVRSSRSSIRMEDHEKLSNTFINHSSILKLISKPSQSVKLSPIGLFALFTQIASIVVVNQKNGYLRNHLPNLVGPIKKAIQPFIDHEFYIYHLLCELTQRNLFCTYFNHDNVDSLLHPHNVNYRQEVIWNLRFASILGFTMNIKDFILDHNKLELIRNMNLSIPYISVSSKDIQELRLMLENRHPDYENDYFYPPESPSRLQYVLDYFTNIKLAPLKDDSESGNCPSSPNYYKCDSCKQVILFPLIVPCPKIHLICIYCIMKKHGYEPIKVDLSSPNNQMSPDLNLKNKFYWPKRGPIRFCVICGDQFQINSDFFDRLQIPIQISHLELKNMVDSNSSMEITPKDPQINTSSNMTAYFKFPLICQLRDLLFRNFKSPEIEETINQLYTKFADIRTSHINNYLYNYIHSFGDSILPFNEIYNNIPLISIGLISLSSSKLRYILHCILKNLEENPNIKIMIVSSLWQQLDFLFYTLTIILNVGACRYYPHIPKSELKRSISNFKKENKTNSFPVLLLSIDIGSHGLDLSCVSNVYILDPIADESIENQTISRAHRIRSSGVNYSYFVKVKYCLIKDTFEDLLFDYIQYKRFVDQNSKSLVKRSSNLRDEDLDKDKVQQ